MATERGRRSRRARVLDGPTLKELAERLGKSVAQVGLRWRIEHGKHRLIGRALDLGPTHDLHALNTIAPTDTIVGHGEAQHGRGNGTPDRTRSVELR